MDARRWITPTYPRRRGTSPGVSHPPALPELARLARLGEKYRALGDLRRARAAGAPIPERRVFRALAEEFPGALHELDHLPLEEIDRRRAALEQAAGGGERARAPWMDWMSAYHALMRAALYLKIRVSREGALSEDEAEALAARAGAHADVAIDAAFVRAVQAPPEGRLNRVVMARLSERWGVAADEIRRALFPRRGA